MLLLHHTALNYKDSGEAPRDLVHSSRFDRVNAKSDFMFPLEITQIDPLDIHRNHKAGQIRTAAQFVHDGNPRLADGARRADDHDEMRPSVRVRMVSVNPVFWKGYSKARLGEVP